MAKVIEFQREFAKAIQEGYAAVFAGAGLSRQSGYVDWKNLLRNLALDIDLNVDKEQDLVAVAQYYCNEKGNRSQLNDIILNKFALSGQENKSLQILAQSSISTYWTTNYDHLIENALKKAGKRVDIKLSQENLATAMDGRDAVVYKMHGDIVEPADCVITKDDYEAYSLSRGLFTTALQGDLISKTFLFIGFSFDDPNLNYILSRIRALLYENQRRHFCFFEIPKQHRNESEEEFSYRANKLELRKHDLKRYAIDAVMLESYGDIPRILEAVLKQVKSNCIFISGSAEIYGEWGEDGAVHLIRTLVKKLCEKNFKIVTGHGKGIGSYVISTILEKYENNIHEIERHMTIRAFPFQDKKNPNYGQLVEKYRSGFYQQAGVLISMFGNKKNSDGEIITAQGAWQEFSLARENDCYIIPIGSTGFTAKKVFDHVSSNLSDYPYLTPHLETLASCMDADRLSDCVIEILEGIQSSF